MIFDFNNAIMMGGMLVFPDTPFVVQPTVVDDTTEYISASTGTNVGLQGSAGVGGLVE